MRMLSPLLAALVLLAASAVPVRAEPNGARAEKEVCAQAYENTQNSKRDGHLVDARAEVLRCLRPTCPTILRADCAQWFDEIERSLPSVVVSARDPAGRPRTDVEVSLDGQPFAGRADGKPFVVDPGIHVFEIHDATGAHASIRAVVAEGQKNVRIDAVLETAGATPGRSSSPATSEPSRRPSYTLPIVFGALGLVAAGSFAFFGLTGKGEQATLERTCSPRCSDEQAAPAFRSYLVADVSLLVSLVSSGAAVFFLTRATSGAETTSRTR